MPVPDPLSLAKASEGQESTLAGLPLEEMFLAPFTAAMDAAEDMATATAEFIRDWAVDASGNLLTFTASSFYDIPAATLVDSTGKQVYYLYTKSTNVLEPTYDASGIGINKDKATGGAIFINNAGTWDVSGVIVAIDNSGRIINSQGLRSLTIPYISILNVPALCMTEVNVEFKMEVKSQEYAETSSKEDATQVQNEQYTSYWSTKRKGKPRNHYSRTTEGAKTTAVSSNTSKSTDSTQTASVYIVKMKASQKVPVGMKMMLDFITNNAGDTAAQMKLSDDGMSTLPAENDLLKNMLKEGTTMAPVKF